MSKIASVGLKLDRPRCTIGYCYTIEHAIEQVYRLQNHSFKINLSFSAIFQNRETQEYKFYYASNNTKLLDKPKLIQNQHDLNNLLNFLSAMISQLISETNRLTPNGYLKGLLIYKYVPFQQHTLWEILQNFWTTLRTIAMSLAWKKINIILI